MEAHQEPDPQPESPEIRWLVPITMAGDAVIFLLFAAIGRASHGEAVGSAVIKTAGTALPFIVGWSVGAFAWKTYGAEVLHTYRTGLTRVAAAWLTGGIVALAIRSFLEHRIVPASFAAIALGFNMLLLLIWRTVIVTTVRHKG